MQVQKKQMHYLGGLCAEAFLDRVTAFVSKELPSETGDLTRDEISSLIERARAHGFTLERTLVTYVLSARLLGLDFDERFPAARAALQADKPEELRAIDLQEITLVLLSDTPAEGPLP